MEKNKIYLGDSYELIKQLPDKSVDCIYTDIPYLLQSGGVGSSPVAQRISRVQYSDLNGIKDGIDYAIFEEFRRVMKKVNLFIWCSKGQLQDIMNYWIDDNDNICFLYYLYELTSLFEKAFINVYRVYVDEVTKKIAFAFFS